MNKYNRHAIKTSTRSDKKNVTRPNIADISRPEITTTSWSFDCFFNAASLFIQRPLFVNAVCSQHLYIHIQHLQRMVISQDNTIHMFPFFHLACTPYNPELFDRHPRPPRTQSRVVLVGDRGDSIPLLLSTVAVEE